MGNPEANRYHSASFGGCCCGPWKELFELSVGNQGGVNPDEVICVVHDIIPIC